MHSLQPAGRTLQPADGSCPPAPPTCASSCSSCGPASPPPAAGCPAGGAAGPRPPGCAGWGGPAAAGRPPQTGSPGLRGTTGAKGGGSEGEAGWGGGRGGAAAAARLAQTGSPGSWGATRSTNGVNRGAGSPGLQRAAGVWLQMQGQSTGGRAQLRMPTDTRLQRAAHVWWGAAGGPARRWSGRRSVRPRDRLGRRSGAGRGWRCGSSPPSAGQGRAGGSFVLGSASQGSAAPYRQGRAGQGSAGQRQPGRAVKRKQQLARQPGSSCPAGAPGSTTHVCLHQSLACQRAPHVGAHVQGGAAHPAARRCGEEAGWAQPAAWAAMPATVCRAVPIYAVFGGWDSAVLKTARQGATPPPPPPQTLAPHKALPPPPDPGSPRHSPWVAALRVVVQRDGDHVGAVAAQGINGGGVVDGGRHVQRREAAQRADVHVPAAGEASEARGGAGGLGGGGRASGCRCAGRRAPGQRGWAHTQQAGGG